MSGQWQTPTRDDKRQTSASSRFPEAAARPPKHPGNDTAPHPPDPTQAESDNVHRSPVSPASEETPTRMRPLNMERNDTSVHTQAEGTRSQQAETPVARAYAAHRSPSTAGRTEQLQAGKKERKNIQQDSGENFRSTSQPGEHIAQYYPQADDRQTGSHVDATRRPPKEIEQESGCETPLGPTGFLKGLRSSSDSEVKISAWQVKKSVDGLGHVNEVRIFNGQHNASPLEDREKVEQKRALPAELCWPSLPGEKSSEDSVDSHPTAIWPSLPDGRSAAVELLSHQVETHPSVAESRTIERLQQLDEEQKGMPWSGSHF